MTDIYLNGGAGSFIRVPYAMVAAATPLTLNLSAVASAAATFASAAPSSQVLSGDLDHLHLKTNVANAFTISGARFSRGGQDYVVKANGDVQVDLSPVTGNGTSVGTMTMGQGEVVIDAWPAGGSPQAGNWRAVAAAPINGAGTPFSTYAITFRVPTAPLRVGSVSVLGTMQDGTTFNVTADSAGIFDSARVKGRVNYATGVVRLVGVTPSAPAGQTQVSLAFLAIPGLTNAYIDLIRQETVRVNAVAYTYLPMDASLLGINPVRLPSDGRVPIFRAGDVIVIGNSKTTAPAAVSNGQTIAVGRTRLSRISVIGNDNLPIYNGWTTNRDAGTVTFNDVTGYSQPVRIEHRIEDMSALRDVQIDGTLTMLRALTHDYLADGTTYVSSAMMTKDLKARVPLLFDQASWNGTTFSDVLVGDPATGTFNDLDNPLVVTNAGALTERWVIRFTSSTAFQVIGENVGVITVGNINTVCAPINPRNGEPYFSIPELGWGVGWNVGNIVRFNTVGAQVPLWVVRTVQQGPEAGEDYKFEIIARGDVDNPI